MMKRDWYQIGMQLALPITLASVENESASTKVVPNRYPILQEKRANIVATHAGQKHGTHAKK